MPRLCFLIVAFLPAFASAADRVEELARFHLEAIGGRERVRALSSMRVTGEVIVSNRLVKFTMYAARPAKLRLETATGARSLVQGTNGEEPAWEFDTATWPPVYRPMADNVARTFTADAEFDDPLVAGEARGYQLEYAGEVKNGERKYWRILVTRKLTDTYQLLVDDETCFIVMKIERRTGLSGRNIQVTTHFEDFRPVQGVLLPHLVTVAADGEASQQTKILLIEANPKMPANAFSRPAVTVPGLQKP